MKATETLSAVTTTYGFQFSETHTGGGCMALEARLETGHWIVATDEMLCGFAERIQYESEIDADGERRPFGWFVGIYPPAEWWGGEEESLYDIGDYDLYAEDLPAIVGRALADFSAVLKSGQPYTGLSYRAQSLGPADIDRYGMG